MKLVVFDGNPIAKVCRVTRARSGRIAERSKADAGSRQRTTDAEQLIYTSFVFDDVPVTKMGELCCERVFVGEAPQIEDEGVVLYASDHRNG